MAAGGIERDIGSSIELAQPGALRQFPQLVAIVAAVLQTAHPGAVVVGGGGQEGHHVLRMRAFGEPVEIELHQVGILSPVRHLIEHGLGRGRGPAGIELELPGQRRAVERHLLAAGGGDHVLADLDHHVADILARGADMAEHRFRKGAVAAVAVIGHRIRLGGVGDQEIGGTADPCQPAAQVLVGQPQRIVAAGVQKHQPQPGHLLQHLHHPVQRHRLRHHLGQVVQRQVDRHQIVLVVDLKGVAGVVEQRHVRLLGLRGELVEQLVHAVAGQVGAEEDLEVQVGQRRGDVMGVVQRIVELRRVLIGAVADHQRGADIRRRQPRPDQRRQQQQPQHGPAQGGHRAGGGPGGVIVQTSVHTLVHTPMHTSVHTQLTGPRRGTVPGQPKPVLQQSHSPAGPGSVPVPDRQPGSG